MTMDIPRRKAGQDDDTPVAQPPNEAAGAFFIGYLTRVQANTVPYWGCLTISVMESLFFMQGRRTTCNWKIV